ncbi:unnamed protein product [Paramecium sonneborni]|uniref:Uncharacterized protein n=1 Tax=Paramecium sonneborni TaxID=65129 RepID=A0A8S1MVG2_9CILI|nr:unnamed protein product [Paramecium sonneborni]
MGSNTSNSRREQAYIKKRENFIEPEVHYIVEPQKINEEQPKQKTDEELQKEREIQQASEQANEAFEELINCMNNLDICLEKFNKDLKGDKQDEDS